MPGTNDNCQPDTPRPRHRALAEALEESERTGEMTVVEVDEDEYAALLDLLRSHGVTFGKEPGR